MALAALFGLFSKENAIVLPVAMLLYDFSSASASRAVLLPCCRAEPADGLVGAALGLLQTAAFRATFVDNPLVGRIS